MARDDNLLCACAELSRERAAAVLAASPGEPFDAFLAATGAGGTCTACMLDLEHFFVEAPRDAMPQIAVSGAAERKAVSLKARLYALLDRLPPKLAYNRSNWMPVLYGVGVRTYLWIANHSLLYVDQNELSDFDIRYTIRNEAGNVIHRGRELLSLVGFSPRKNPVEIAGQVKHALIKIPNCQWRKIRKCTLQVLFGFNNKNNFVITR